MSIIITERHIACSEYIDNTVVGHFDLKLHILQQPAEPSCCLVRIALWFSASTCYFTRGPHGRCCIRLPELHVNHLKHTDNIRIVTEQLRSYQKPTPFSFLYSTCMPSIAMRRRFKWHCVEYEHTTLFTYMFNEFGTLISVSSVLTWASSLLVSLALINSLFLATLRPFVWIPYVFRWLLLLVKLWVLMLFILKLLAGVRWSLSTLKITLSELESLWRPDFICITDGDEFKLRYTLPAEICWWSNKYMLFTFISSTTWMFECLSLDKGDCVCEITIWKWARFKLGCSFFPTFLTGFIRILYLKTKLEHQRYYLIKETFVNLHP